MSLAAAAIDRPAPSGFMPPMWHTVDAQTARRHPLHGMGGWLAVFSILLVVGTGYSVVTVAGVVTDPTQVARLISPESLTILQAQAVWMGVTSALLLILWFIRARPFRAIWTLVVLANTGFGAVSAYLVAADLQQRFGNAPGVDPATQAGAAVAAGLVGLLLFNWYMGASRRFRVTFQRQVKAGDPLLQSAVAPALQTPSAWDQQQQRPGWRP